MPHSGDTVARTHSRPLGPSEDFARAARRLGVEVVLGWDRCKTLAAGWSEPAIAIDFRRPEAAAREVVEATGDVAGIVATDERTALIAALAAERLGLPFNPVTAARATADKLALRQRLASAGVAQPAFRELALDADVGAVARELRFPVVIKPRQLSTSRGVMRADDAAELASRFERRPGLLARPQGRPPGQRRHGPAGVVGGQPSARAGCHPGRYRGARRGGPGDHAERKPVLGRSEGGARQ